VIAVSTLDCPPQRKEGGRMAAPVAGNKTPLAALADRLRAIARRAESARWAGGPRRTRTRWRPRSLRSPSSEESLRAGMRDAFEIGRQYGKGEDVLARLDEEIDEATRRLARAAWGGEPLDAG
jgi:hypothetical protein